MRIIKDRMNIDFQIKAGNRYVTVATLVPWFISKHSCKYELYFFYYGEEYAKGTYACSHFNGNVSMTVWREKYELKDEFILRISKIVRKKLYVIGSSIINEIKNIDIGIPIINIDKIIKLDNIIISMKKKILI